jgi:hypothetical protein
MGTARGEGACGAFCQDHPMLQCCCHAPRYVTVQRGGYEGLAVGLPCPALAALHMRG